MIHAQICEICGLAFTGVAPEEEEVSLECACRGRQDPAFYVWESVSEVVWKKPELEYYVIRAGEMRINATSKSGEEEVIRYTDQLLGFGITNDEELGKWTGKGEEVFDWGNNSWFEVLSKEDGDFYSEAIYELDEAIAYAMRLNEEEEA